LFQTGKSGISLSFKFCDADKNALFENTNPSSSELLARRFAP
jgi:hypothetical protein